MIRGLPAGLVGHAKARARADDTTLDAVLITYLARYAEQGPPGLAGAQARAASLSPERRSEIARIAVRAREAQRITE